MIGSFRVKRSGGPKTAEGKAVASRNSLKTGMYASAVVLPHENPADFEALNESLLVELDAQGLLEASLVREIAVVTWKKLRLEGLEARCLSELLTRPETPEEFYEVGFVKTEGSDWALSNLEKLNEEFVETCRQDLANSKSERPTFKKGWATELKRKAPEAFERYMDLDRERQAQKSASSSFNLQIILNREQEESDGVSDEVERRLETVVEVFHMYQRNKNKGAIYVAERLEEVSRLKGVIRDKRLSEFLGEDRFQRGHEDLNRALSRALRELRAQQAWRKKREVIDVTPNELKPKAD